MDERGGIEEALERLLTDPVFRERLSIDPRSTLDGYDLTADDLSLLATAISTDGGGQRTVEARHSKAGMLGLFSQLAGGTGVSGAGSDRTPVIDQIDSRSRDIGGFNPPPDAPGVPGAATGLLGGGSGVGPLGGDDAHIDFQAPPEGDDIALGGPDTVQQVDPVAESGIIIIGGSDPALPEPPGFEPSGSTGSDTLAIQDSEIVQDVALGGPDTVDPSDPSAESGIIIIGGAEPTVAEPGGIVVDGETAAAIAEALEGVDTPAPLDPGIESGIIMNGSDPSTPEVLSDSPGFELAAPDFDEETKSTISNALEGVDGGGSEQSPPPAPAEPAADSDIIINGSDPSTPEVLSESPGFELAGPDIDDETKSDIAKALEGAGGGGSGDDGGDDDPTPITPPPGRP